jgi:mannose-6-phosphate isomerase
LSDRDLPLFVRLIFAAEMLSVRVHPGDGEEGPRGKTEMWHILEAGPSATITLGSANPSRVSACGRRRARARWNGFCAGFR